MERIKVWLAFIAHKFKKCRVMHLLGYPTNYYLKVLKIK